MALNFPSSPTVGQTHDATNGLSYTYDGVKWTSQGSYPESSGSTSKKIDDISSDFNGTTTTFNLHHNSTDISILSTLDVLISIGGVIQEPDVAYTVNTTASTITFSEAPSAGDTFFGILKSKLVDQTITSDGSVTSFSDNVDITGTLTVSSFTTLNSSLNVKSDDALFTVKNGSDAVKFTVDTDNGNTSIAGNLDITGGLDANGNVNLGNATSDTITATGRFDSDLVPSTDNARDLGASGLEYKDLYIDGTAHIDTLDIDENATIAGTLGVTSATTLSSTLAVTGKSTFNHGLVLTKVSTTLPNATTFAVTKAWHELTSYGDGVTTDTIEGATGGTAGQILILTAATGHTITLNDGTDSNDFMLGSAINLVGDDRDTVVLMYNGTNWLKIGHCEN